MCVRHSKVRVYSKRLRGSEYPTERTAQRITMIFSDKELERETDNAEGLIRQKFTRTAATERYDKMLKEVLPDLQRPTV